MDFLAPLDDLAVVRISGADAVGFLHSQLSNDISGMTADDARLAAYCNPKGRMLGSLVLWRETAQADSPILALVKADLLDPVLKRLRMFVLRAKVTFEPTTLKVHGLSRMRADKQDGASPGPGSISETATAWRVRREGPFTYIVAPGAPGGPARCWLVDTGNTETAELASHIGLPTAAARAWHAQDIEAGLGWVEQANVELFIPQSLNFDLVGGVSFTKGCYPGQEVVARAHFRGAVKRRAIAGTCADVSGQGAGTDVFDALRPRAPAGRIINCARTQGGTRLLMEVSLSDIGEADFRVESPQGQPVRLLPLPYPLEA